MDFNAQIDLKNYTKLEKIGQGQTGKVFKIKDNKSGKEFAAKVSSFTLSSYTKAQNLNLLRELNIMAKIDHPNIVKFIGYSPSDFSNKDKPVIVTELLTNGTLANVIEKERKSLSLPLWDDTRKLISIYGIAAAMNFLHSHGIIHRDLKPSNILMDELLYPKVADFGLSKCLDSLDTLNIQSTVSPKGTPIYMAPEILTNNLYTPACDVYAFAMIVFEIMSNEIPFKGNQIFKIYEEVKNGIRPRFSFVIPKPYRVLIECCWSQNPEERPTFEQIIEVLKNNKDFITNTVDECEYLDYIDYVEEYQASFDKTKKIKSLDERKQSRKEKKTKGNETKSLPRTSSEYGKNQLKVEISNQKITIQDKIAMFNKIKIMGTPVKEPLMKKNSNNNLPPRIPNAINEKKALFENNGTNQKQETKCQLRNNDSQNSDNSKVDSYSPSTNSSIKRIPPLIQSNDKKIVENENKKTPPKSKYKEEIERKIAMFNNLCLNNNQKDST